MLEGDEGVPVFICPAYVTGVSLFGDPIGGRALSYVHTVDGRSELVLGTALDVAVRLADRGVEPVPSADPGRQSPRLDLTKSRPSGGWRA